MLWMKYMNTNNKFVYIRIRIHKEMSPTERAIFRLFANETFIQNGHEFMDNVVSLSALPHTLKYVTSERLWRKYHERTRNDGL